MPVVVFECDTCKRQVEKIRNTKGLEVTGNCIITDGCKGKLHQVSLKPAHIVNGTIAPVEGLEDYIQRKVLYTHKQTLSSDTWVINHNLNTEPSVQVFVYDDVDTNQLNEIEPEIITINSSNQITLNFSRVYTGVAQLIARSSTEGQTITSFSDNIIISETETVQLTTSNELTIATLYKSSTPSENYLDIEFTFISSNTSEQVTPAAFTFNGVNTSFSPWGGNQRVLINGKIYTIRSQTIDPTLLANAGVQDASPFYISNITNGSTAVNLNSGDVLILLTNSPYTSFDRNFSNYIDLSSVTANNASTNTIYSSRELRAFATLKQTAFPEIQIPNF